MFHYCDCPKTEREKKRKNSSRVPMTQTKVDDEGICINCGHYAVATREIKNSVSLYKLITGPVVPVLEREKKKGRWQDYYEEHSLGL